MPKTANGQKSRGETNTDKYDSNKKSAATIFSLNNMPEKKCLNRISLNFPS